MLARFVGPAPQTRNIRAWIACPVSTLPGMRLILISFPAHNLTETLRAALDAKTSLMRSASGPRTHKKTASKSRRFCVRRNALDAGIS
jgi:hypothetical protein